MKRYLVLASLLVAVGLVSFNYSYASFPVQVTSPKGTFTNDGYDACTGTHKLVVYQKSTGYIHQIATCTGSQYTSGGLDTSTLGVGVYGLAEYNSFAGTLGDNFYHWVGLTPTQTSVLQVTPDYTTGTVASDISGSNFDDFLQSIGQFLVAWLPSALAVLAALIGLGFLITRVKRWIGKKA